MSFHFHLATSLAKEEVEEPRKEPKGCNLSGCGGASCPSATHTKQIFPFLSLF